MKIRTIILFIILFFASFLRFYHNNEIPHGLYIDEVSIGYNAYTILHTGKDEHGEFFPLFFQAFGEYKLPVYIYLTSLSMLIFGKTEFAVRFPSALFGTLTVLLMYFFTKILFELNSKIDTQKAKQSLEIPVIAAALLAISPWHIQFSRGGFEMTVALFFFILSAYYFLKFYQKPNLFFLLCGSLAMITTVYTYQSFRIIVPIILFCAFFFSVKKHSSHKKLISSIAGLSILLLIPIALFSFTGNGMSRFAATSAFSEYPTTSVIEKIVTYPLVYLRNYLSYFSLSFLFVTGDGIGRHTVTGAGQLFRWEIIPLLIGIYAMIKNYKTNIAKIIVLLLVVAPIPAAFARPSPHALRSLVLVIPLIIIVTLGLIKLWENKKRWSYATIVLLFFFAIFEFSQYMHLYYVHYPMITALDWGAEYKQLVTEATKQQKKYDYIVINTSLYNPEYIQFYNNKLVYQYVENSWQKPQAWEGKKVLYINSPEEKYNKYLKKIPHKQVTDIHYPNLNNDIFAEFWEI